jgi:hypothetical protein
MSETNCKNYKHSGFFKHDVEEHGTQQDNILQSDVNKVSLMEMPSSMDY